MIIHADMDAFFASVEIREQPELSGRPVVVGGKAENRGVVAAASYAARQFGIRSAMPTSAALKRCPDLIVLPSRIGLYAEVSQQIHAIFARYTPLIEPLSLDEAFLDVSASTALFGSASDIAREIQQAVATELQLAVSIGVAPNKFLAKIASDLEKPNGFVVVQADEAQAFLDPLPVSRIWGVGKITEQRLHALSIHLIRELRQLPQSTLTKHFGRHGEHLWQLAHGQDDRAVIPEHTAKSISHETTFAHDITSPELLRSTLSDLTEQVAWRMRKKGLHGRTVQLKLRFDDFRSITRARTLGSASNSTHELWQCARQLLEKEIILGLPPIRLIGMGVGGFVDNDAQNPSNQHDLFAALDTPANPTGAAVDKVADEINSRFGDKLLSRARGLGKPRSNH